MSTLHLEDFDYPVEKSAIALYPSVPRDHARLLVFHRSTQSLHHTFFSSIVEHLCPGDVLVLNNTRVLPARLKGKKEGTGGKVDILLVRERTHHLWEVLMKGKARTGQRLLFNGGVEGEVVEDFSGGRRAIRFLDQSDVLKQIETVGETPLPPYIKRRADPGDKERYQTVYATVPGSIAAPTAGLHFTADLLRKVQLKGVRTVFITLHIGPATFQKIAAHHLRHKTLEPETFSIPQRTVEEIEMAKARGGRIIAVGTSTVRALEAGVRRGKLQPLSGETDLFILPGRRFHVVDGLLTNFHLPRSSVLMLVMAFAGREETVMAYQHALKKGYRFYSFGDAMLIL